MWRYDTNYLAHHGTKGQKWGIRHYQYEDGSYKPGAEGRYYDPVDGGRHHRALKPSNQNVVRVKNTKKPNSKQTNSSAKPKKQIDKKKVAKYVAAGVATTAVVGTAAYFGSKKVKSTAARIAAEQGMKQYKKLIKSGDLRLAQGVSANKAAIERGKAIYSQVAQNVSTKAATKSTLEYLASGKSLNKLPSAASLGQQKSMAGLALDAAKAQAKNVKIPKIRR